MNRVVPIVNNCDDTISSQISAVQLSVSTRVRLDSLAIRSGTPTAAATEVYTSSYLRSNTCLCSSCANLRWCYGTNLPCAAQASGTFIPD